MVAVLLDKQYTRRGGRAQISLRRQWPAKVSLRNEPASRINRGWRTLLYCSSPRGHAGYKYSNDDQ